MSHPIGRWRAALGYRHGVLAACMGAYFAVRFAQLLVSPLVPSLLDAFDASRGAAGAALTGMWLSYAATQLPSGALTDRHGPRAVVLAALALTGAAALLFVGVTSVLAFGAVVVVLGAGAGLYYNAATALLAAEGGGVGGAIGTHRVGSQVAGLAAPVAATALAARWGWRVALASGAVAAALALAVIARRVRPVTPARPAAALRDLVAPGAVRAVVGPALAFTTLLATLGEFAMLATMSFLPTLLVEHHGLSVARAGLLFAGYFAVAAAVQPAAGWLSDRIGRDAVIAALLAAGVVGYAAAATGAVALAVPAVGLVGLSMNWTPPVQSRAVDLLSAAERGVGFGLVRTVYLLVGALGPVVAGAVADAAGWGASFGLLAALLAAALAAVGCNRLLGLGL